jgi:Tol biopolymer transport system component
LEALGFAGQSSDEYGAYRVNLETGEIDRLEPGFSQSVWNPSLSPDGAKLSFTDQAGRGVYDFNTQGIIHLPPDIPLTDPLQNRWSLSWSPRISYGPGACEENK